MTKRVQYARTTAEAVALLLKNDIDIWWTYDVIRERIEAAGIEGEDLDGYANMRDLIRMVRNSVIDGTDLAAEISEEEREYVFLRETPEEKAQREGKDAARLQKNREVLASVMGYLAPEKFRPSSAERS